MPELFELLSVSRPRRGAAELLVCVALRERDVPHGFSLRSHGFGRSDRAPSDREGLALALGLPHQARMRQVHGREVRSLDGPPSEPPPCDGLATAREGLGLVVQSADCVPLLCWDERTNAAAAVHAGWRGTLLGVARAAVDELGRSHGTEPRDLHVALGPAIRSCCFEVGKEVVEAFEATGRDLRGVAYPGRRGRPHLDLIEDNRRQLVLAGVSEERIYDCGRCTACENERFYSYRKEGRDVGRILGIVAPRRER